MCKGEFSSFLLVKNIYNLLLLYLIIIATIPCSQVTAIHGRNVADNTEGFSSLNSSNDQGDTSKNVDNNNSNNNNNNDYQNSNEDYHPDFLVLEIEEGENGNRDGAFQEARRLGLTYHGKVGSLDNLYLFKRMLLDDVLDDRDNNSNKDHVETNKIHKEEENTKQNSIIGTNQHTLLWKETHKSTKSNNGTTSSNRYKDVFSRLDHDRKHMDKKGSKKRQRRHNIKRRSIVDIADELVVSNPSIKSVKPQVPLRRSKRDWINFNDPFYPRQWSIHGGSIGGKTQEID